MNTFAAGDAVKCGICGKDTKISFVTDRTGGKAYDLECLHRNAYCDTCEAFIRDASDTIQEIVPACRTCNPEMFDDEDDDE